MSEYCAPELTLGSVVRQPSVPQMPVRAAVGRTVSNLPIRVPSIDWAAVITGRKQMFRTYNGSKARPEMPVVPPETECPRPCLLYSVRQEAHKRDWLATPGVLLSHRQEPLGSITPEDLAKEGFEYLPAFRFYWRQRYRTLGWRPWDMVSVLEVRPWQPHDRDDFGDWAVAALFGEWFDDHNPGHD